MTPWMFFLLILIGLYLAIFCTKDIAEALAAIIEFVADLLPGDSDVHL